MTARPDRRSEQWPAPSRRLRRLRARRMRRRLAAAGVQIPAARLREVIAGAPLASEESIDVTFALTVAQFKREQRAARAKRTRQRLVHLLIVAGLMVAALNLLVCMGYAIISLALHESPL